MSSITRLFLISVFLLTAVIAGCDGQQTPTDEKQKPVDVPTDPTTDGQVPEVLYLDQGFSADDRQAFYYLTQGSQLMPYFWFLALEETNSEALFRSDQHMSQLA